MTTDVKKQGERESKKKRAKKTFFQKAVSFVKLGMKADSIETDEGCGLWRRYSVCVIRILCGCVYTFLLARTQLAFSVYPFALAFLSSAGRYLPFYCASAVLCALFTGREMAVYAALYAMILLVRSVVCIYSSLCSDGELRIPDYSEPAHVKLILGCTVGMIAGAYNLFLLPLTQYSLFGSLLVMAVCPIGTYIFTEADKDERKMEMHGAARIFSCALLVLSLSRISFLLFNSGAVAALFLTMTEAPKGSRSSALMGIAAGVSFGLSSCAVYALGGALGGLLSSLSPTLGTVSVFAFVTMAEGYVGGYSSLVSLLPSAGLALFMAILWQKYRIAERISAICLVSVEQKETTGEGDVMRTADRMAELSHAFASMSGMMRSLCAKEDRARMIDTSAILRESVEAVCPACPNRGLCWEKHKQKTNEAISHTARELSRIPRLCESDLPPYLRDTCVSLPSLLSQINSRAREASRSILENGGWGTLVSDYEAMSKLIDSHIEKYEQDDKADPAGTEKLTELSRKRLYGIGKLEVRGGRRKKILASGIELRFHTVSAARLRYDFERALCCKLSPPVYGIGGSDITFEMHSVPVLSARHAHAALPKEGEGCCGDTSCVIENADGYVYGILCDGMGSGKEAAYTSSVCAEYLSSMLGYSNPKELTIEMLNAVLRSRVGECSSTVDLFELDTYTGEGCFIKSGAAPSFVCRGKNVYKVASKTIPIGITERIGAEKIKFRLRAGDVVVMVSDGIVEGPDEGRLVVEALCRRASNEPFDIAAAVLSRAKSEYNARDDMTVVVICIDPLQ